MRITDTTQYSGSPSLVWTGTEYGIAWMEGPYNGWNIYFASFDSAGAKQGEDVPITDASGSAKGPSLAWSGTGYGLAWSEGSYQQHEIYFTRVSASGAAQGDPTRITKNTWDSRVPSLAWTGTEYGMTWEDGRGVYTYRDVYFARVNDSAIKQGENMRITTQEDSWVPCLAWSGTEYGVVWRDTRSGIQLNFALLDSVGTKQ